MIKKKEKTINVDIDAKLDVTITEKKEKTIINEIIFDQQKIKGQIMAFTLTNPTADVVSQPAFKDGSSAPYLLGSFTNESLDTNIFTVEATGNELNVTLRQGNPGTTQLKQTVNPDPSGATQNLITKLIDITVPAPLASQILTTIDGQPQ